MFVLQGLAEPAAVTGRLSGFLRLCASRRAEPAPAADVGALRGRFRPLAVRACLFSYFELDDLTRLMNAISASGMPAGTRVHIGSYGINAEASTTVHTYGPGRYSPMF